MDLTGFFAGIAGSFCIVYVSLCIENNVQCLAVLSHFHNFIYGIIATAVTQDFV